MTFVCFISYKIGYSVHLFSAVKKNGHRRRVQVSGLARALRNTHLAMPQSGHRPLRVLRITTKLAISIQTLKVQWTYKITFIC